MKSVVPGRVEQEEKHDFSIGAFKCALFCEAKKCCKKYKRGKRCKSCPKK